MSPQTQQFPKVYISAFAREQISLIHEWPKIKELVKSSIQPEGIPMLQQHAPHKLIHIDAQGVKYLLEINNATATVLIRLAVET